MKKTYRLENLDCANCAAKMEQHIRKIAGVQSASVSFLSQKLTLEADEADWERITHEAAKLCKKIEPDCTILF